MHWVCPLMLSPLLETLSHRIPFVKNVDPTGQFLNDSERVPCQVIAVIEERCPLEKVVEKSNRVNRKVLEGYNTLKYTNRE